MVDNVFKPQTRDEVEVTASQLPDSMVESYFINACAEEHELIIDALINRLDSIPDACVVTCQKSSILKKLIDHGANADAWNGYALLKHCKTGNFECAKILVENGSSIESIAIEWAIVGEFTDIVKLIVDNSRTIHRAAFGIAKSVGNEEIISILNNKNNGE